MKIIYAEDGKEIDVFNADDEEPSCKNCSFQEGRPQCDCCGPEYAWKGYERHERVIHLTDPDTWYRGDNGEIFIDGRYNSEFTVIFPNNGCYKELIEAIKEYRAKHGAI